MQLRENNNNTNKILYWAGTAGIKLLS
jgi:hypothetical protein